MNNIRHVFLVGAKSLGAYGGYETFINKLTEYHQNDSRIQYHVACKGNGEGCMDETKVDGVTRISDSEFYYHNAHCFKIQIPEKLGPAQAIYYDVMALKKCCEIIRREQIQKPVVYIMACRIGPFMQHFYQEIHKLGGRTYLNPDGHEWMRAKWSAPIRKYWKISEQMMVKYSDLVICDSINIEKYIHECYDGKGVGGTNPRTTYIAYGAETRQSRLADDDSKFVDWLRAKGLERNNFLSTLIQILCRTKIYDVTSGMRAVNKKMIAFFAREYAQDYPEPEAILAASMEGARIVEVPVQMRERSAGVSSINAFKPIYYMIKVSISLIVSRFTYRRVRK